MPNSGKICEFSKEKVTEWAGHNEVKSLYSDVNAFEQVCEIFAVIVRGIELATKNKARHTQIACSIFFFYNMGHVG